MGKCAKAGEVVQTVVPFTLAVLSGRGCPDTGLSLGSESDVTIGSQRCADNGCCVVPVSNSKY